MKPSKNFHVWAPGGYPFYNEFGDGSIIFQFALMLNLTGRQTTSMTRKGVGEICDANDFTILYPICTLDFGIKGDEKLSNMKMSFAEENHK